MKQETANTIAGNAITAVFSGISLTTGFYSFAKPPSDPTDPLVAFFNEIVGSPYIPPIIKEGVNFTLPLALMIVGFALTYAVVTNMGPLMDDNRDNEPVIYPYSSRLLQYDKVPQSDQVLRPEIQQYYRNNIDRIIRRPAITP